MKKIVRSLLACIAATLVSVPGVFADDFEIYAEFDKSLPPGNLAIGPKGRMFMSLHGFYGPELRLVEVFADGSTRPYPTETWARAPEKDGDGLNGVLGLRVDREGILWLLDGPAENSSGRVIGWNTKTEQLHAIFYIASPVLKPTSFLNDLAIDREHGAIYIADTGDGKNSALIVVDLDTGRARRLLEGSKFTVPEDIPMKIEGREITMGAAPARVGINPITIDPSNRWLYFGPMSGTSLYRVRTEDVLDSFLSNTDLERHVERYGSKPISDGSTIDTAGNVYMTSVTESAIGVTRPDGRYEVMHRSPKTLPWPDGFAVGVDGWVYATVNELYRSPVLNKGKDVSQGKFSIVRFKPLEEAVSGR